MTGTTEGGKKAAETRKQRGTQSHQGNKGNNKR